eukprot:493440-Amphidinium_carterae.1
MLKNPRTLPKKGNTKKWEPTVVDRAVDLLHTRRHQAELPAACYGAAISASAEASNWQLSLRLLALMQTDKVLEKNDHRDPKW